MKRLLVGSIILLVATAAMAFDPERKAPTIAVVTSSLLVDGGTPLVARLLREELREAGLDAFTIEAGIEDMCGAEPRQEADYVVEIVSMGARPDHHGGIDVGGRNVSVGVGVVSSTVVAELRVYDTSSCELLVSRELVGRRGALVPTAIGLGGRHFFGWIALPIGEVTQHRRAARAVARDAAAIVRDVTGAE